MRRRILAGALAGLSLAWATAGVEAAAKTKRHISAATIEQIISGGSGDVQLVSFPATGWNPVKVVRGGSTAKTRGGPKPNSEKAEAAEIVPFADPQASPVRVLRGDGIVASAQARPARAMDMQIVSFADAGNRSVTVFRGPASYQADAGFFATASAPDLDRIAFAVDGAESSHGLDLRMWRAEPSGPQGPMQITRAAATDVGGGDRFDLTENRALGRAYLARMFSRYGNWPDAIAAYNWGPGNVDVWIGGGRVANQLPLGVERYRDRVLRDAALGWPGPALLTR